MHLRCLLSMLLLATALGSCIHRVPPPLPVVELGPPLTRLSRAVDAVADAYPVATPPPATPGTPGSKPVHDGGDTSPGPGTPLTGDPGLLDAATTHDPSLLEPFRGYHLEAAARAGYGVVLVCTPDRSVLLLEDAGCTPNLDVAWYREAEPVPCAFTLDPVRLCQVAGTPVMEDAGKDTSSGTGARTSP